MIAGNKYIGKKAGKGSGQEQNHVSSEQHWPMLLEQPYMSKHNTISRIKKHSKAFDICHFLFVVIALFDWSVTPMYEPNYNVAL